MSDGELRDRSSLDKETPLRKELLDAYLYANITYPQNGIAGGIALANVVLKEMKACACEQPLKELFAFSFDETVQQRITDAMNKAHYAHHVPVSTSGARSHPFSSGEKWTVPTERLKELWNDFRKLGAAFVLIGVDAATCKQIDSFIGLGAGGVSLDELADHKSWQDIHILYSPEKVESGLRVLEVCDQVLREDEAKKVALDMRQTMREIMKQDVDPSEKRVQMVQVVTQAKQLIRSLFIKKLAAESALVKERYEKLNPLLDML